MLKALNEEQFFLRQKGRPLYSYFERAKSWLSKTLFVGLSILIVLFSVSIPTASSQAGLFTSCIDVGNYAGRPLVTVGSGIENLLQLNGDKKSPDSAYGVAGAKYSWYNIEGADMRKREQRQGVYYQQAMDKFDTPNDNAPNGKCRDAWDHFGPGFMTGVNNFIININSFIYQATAWILQNAYSNNIGEMMINIASAPIEFMKNNLYLSAIGLVLLAVGITIVINALKGTVRRGFTGALWAVSMVLLFALLIWNPRLLPNMASTAINAINGAILSVASSSNSINYCENAAYTKSADQKAAKGPEIGGEAVAKGTCAMWATFIFTPWSSGQFGQQPSDLTTINGFAVPEDRALVTGGGSSNWALYQYAIQSKTPNDKEKSDPTQMKAFGNIIDVVYAGQQIDRDLWSGHDGGRQFVMTLMGTLSVILGAWLIGGIAIKVLIYGILIPLTTFLLPFIGIIAPHQTFGKRAVIKYFGTIAGYVGKSIIYTLVLMLVLLVFMGVTSQSANGKLGWWYAIFILVIFTFAAKKITSLLEGFLNFGGGGGAGADPTESITSKTKSSAMKTAAISGAGAMAGLAAAKRLNPLGKKGREDIADTRKEILRSKGLDEKGKKIESEKDKKKRLESERLAAEKMKEQGFTKDEKTGLITDKDGNIDKSNWVRDSQGKLHAPNSRVAQKIKEKEQRMEEYQARKEVKKANRKAIASQFARTAKGTVSATAKAAVAAKKGGARTAIRNRRVQAEAIAKRAQERKKKRVNNKVDKRKVVEEQGRLPKRVKTKAKKKFDEKTAQRRARREYREEQRKKKKEKSGEGKKKFENWR